MLTPKGMVPYPIPKPTDDYRDALATGRCCIYCLDLEHSTIIIANIYGWTGAIKGNNAASRTDDLLTIVINQFSMLPPGPKMIAGDLDGPPDAPPTLQALLQPDEGWADVGMDKDICGGNVGRYTCHANEGVKESRIDYIITNCWLTPALKNGRVDLCDDFPTHKHFVVDVRLAKLKQTLKAPRPVTNYANMYEDKVQKEYDEATATLKEQRETQQNEERAKDTINISSIRKNTSKSSMTSWTAR